MRVIRRGMTRFGYRAERGAPEAGSANTNMYRRTGEVDMFRDGIAPFPTHDPSLSFLFLAPREEGT